MPKKVKKEETAIDAVETAAAETVETVETDETGLQENSPVPNVAKENLIEFFKTQILEPIKKKNGTNAYQTSKDLESYARDFSGEGNKWRRIAWLATGLEVEKNAIAETKATTTALATMFTNIMQDLEPGENVRENVLKKEKDILPGELETALTKTFAFVSTVTDRVKELTADEINLLQAAVFAALQTAIRLLSTKENPIPRSAVNFITFLIGASNGSTNWFECTDGFIAESSTMSTKTVQRSREELVTWMNKSGKGIVAIKQEVKKPTLYKINLLESVTAITQNMLNSETGNTESLLIVAGLSGRLLTESTDKIRSEVSDEDLAAARNLNESLAAAIEILPKPELTVSDSAAGRKVEATKKKFETLRTDIGTAIEQAHKHGLEDVLASLEKLSLEARNAGNKYDAEGGEVDMTGLENQLNANRIKIGDAARSEVSTAEAIAAEEKAKTGEVTAETLSHLAKVNIDAAADVAAAIEGYHDDARTAFYLIAEATGRESRDAQIAARLRLADALDAAFGEGQYKATA